VIVDVRKGPRRAAAFLSDVICVFAARVSQAIGDALLGAGTRMVIFVVTNLSHFQLLLL
jgi:hypothetical protein